MRLQLYFRLNGLSYDAIIKLHHCPFVKYFFPRAAETVAKLPLLW